MGEDEPAAFAHELPLTPEEREFATWLSRIESRRVRKRLIDLARSLAEDEPVSAEA